MLEHRERHEWLAHRVRVHEGVSRPSAFTVGVRPTTTDVDDDPAVDNHAARCANLSVLEVGDERFPHRVERLIARAVDDDHGYDRTRAGSTQVARWAHLRAGRTSTTTSPDNVGQGGGLPQRRTAELVRLCVLPCLKEGESHDGGMGTVGRLAHDVFVAEPRRSHRHRRERERIVFGRGVVVPLPVSALDVPAHRYRTCEGQAKGYHTVDSIAAPSG